MKFKRLLIWLPPVCLLLLLTGCFGVFPPRIQGLGKTCGDYCGGRLILVVFPVALFLLGFAAVHAAEGNRKTAVSSFLCSISVVASGYINMALLDQDPAGAWLNWKSPVLTYHPEWGYGIENHEHIYREPGSTDVYAGSGA